MDKINRTDAEWRAKLADGPKAGGKRYCINSSSLSFNAEDGG